MKKIHWGDDWSHDNINFITMKNYLDPDPEEVKSIEKYLIDFMWNNYMKYTQSTYTVANYLSASGVYGTSASPYTRTYSEVMEATGFYNMYRLEKAYPDLIEYRESPEWYLAKSLWYLQQSCMEADLSDFYGEQQIPDMIESLREEGMFEEADNLQEQFAKNKGTNMATADYPYGSEFEYDNTGEEGAYAAAKAKEVLGKMPDHITMRCSGNIIKNVKGVKVPNSGGMKGVEAAAVLGITGGDPSQALEVLEHVTDREIDEAEKLLKAGFCDCVLKDDVANLYIEAYAVCKKDREE